MHAETAQKVLENRAKVLDKVLDDPNFERKSVRSQSSQKKEEVQKTSRFLDSQRMVGENGSGKTTISRIIYSVLSCNWDMLRIYPFDKIVHFFDDSTIQIESSTINAI